MTKQFKLVRTVFVVSMLTLLIGCATPRLKVSNDVTSLREYKEVYLLVGKEDPRNVVPQVVSRLEGMGFKVKVVEPDKPLEPPQGTGFIISKEGHILTCEHVLEEEKVATIWQNGKRYEAELIGSDKEKDLALLKAKEVIGSDSKPLIFRKDTEYKMGQEIYTIGYPLTNILGNAPRLTKGLISSPMGLKDDPDYMQISAEVQPGNSGGPLLDQNGSAIGVIHKTLSPIHVLLRTGGALPQNVNFALKSHVALEFLARYGIDLASGPKEASVSFDKAKDSVVQIRAGIVPAGSENIPKIVARLAYLSMWDMWYRFKVFHIEFYDFETGKLLLKAGQYGDNMVSTEAKVIDATFEQIRARFISRN